jgi:hypothetical protein
MHLLASLVVSGLVWQGGTEIAVGGAERGPWRQNESRYHYVDDPAVAIDERGEVAVAWVNQARRDVFFRRTGQAINVSRSPDTFSWLPRLITSPQRPGMFHLLWQEIIFSGGSHGGDILHARSTDGGKTFSAPLNLSNSVGGDGKGRTSREHWHNGSLDIAAGADGAVYAAWTEYEGRLLLAVSGDGGKGFSAGRHIAGNDRRPARAPSLAIGPDRTLYLAWTTGDIRIARSADGGATFGEPLVLMRTGAYADAPKIAVDSRNTLHLSFSESGNVVYARSSDGARSFEAPRTIAAGTFPSLDVDTRGGVYLLWELERGLGLALSRSNGDGFSVTSPLPRSAGDAANGNLQGKLTDKIAVNAAGEVAVVNSSFREGERSRVWLLRARPADRSARAPR